MARLYGSIDLTKVPKELFKKVTLKDGSVHTFLNISIGERKTPMAVGNGRVLDHFISCQPKKEERKEGVNYFIGDLTEYKENKVEASVVTAEAIDLAPAAGDDDLLF